MSRDNPYQSTGIRSVFFGSNARTAILLALYHFMAMSSFTALKPVRNALLLDRLGNAWIPVADIGTALATGLVVYGMGWVAGVYKGRGPVTATTLLLLSVMLLFRQLFLTAGNWVALAFFVYVGVLSSVMLTQFWLLAGEQFTARDAKRLYGIVGAGGVIGGIVGPAVTYKAVGALGTENLIYVSAAFMVLCLPLVAFFERHIVREEANPDPQDERSGLDLVREIRHVKLIGAVLGASLVAQKVLDFQFQTVADQVFESADGKTAFFAQIFTLQNVVSLVIHLFLTRWVLLKFGVGLSLILLPATLALGATGVLLLPTLTVLSVGKLAEGSLRYSLQEATREVLYMPLPASVRTRVRPLVDMLGMRVFEGLAAGLILFFVAVVPIPIRYLSVISLLVIGGWILAVVAVKKEYLVALRDLFSGFDAAFDSRAAEVLDHETVSFYARQLNDPDPDRAYRALTLIDLLHDKAPVLGDLIHAARTHPDSTVRAGVMGVLMTAGERSLLDEARAMLQSEIATVRLAGVRYLCRFGTPGDGEALRERLSDPDPCVRMAALGTSASSQDPDPVRKAVELSLESGADPACLVEAAHLLATLNQPRYDDLFFRLITLTDETVCGMALHAAGLTRRKVFVPHIVPLLGNAALTLMAARALREYGDGVVYTLRDYFEDPEEPPEVRAGIPSTYAAIGTQRAANVLVDLIVEHIDQRRACIDALVAIQARHPTVSIDHTRVEEVLRTVVEDTGDIARQSEHVVRVVTGLLSLIYCHEDVQLVTAGMLGREERLRSNALELLDNLLSPEHKRLVMPFVEKCIKV